MANLSGPNDVFFVDQAVSINSEILPDLPQKILRADGQPFWNGGLVTPTGDAFMAIRKSRRITDLLRYTYWETLIIRQDVIRQIDNAGMTLSPHERYPLHIVDPGARRPWSEYVILRPLIEIDVLDLGRSQVRYYDNGVTMSEVIRWAVDPAKLPQYDAFAVNRYRWMCKPSFQRFVTNQGFTGFSFPLVE